VVATRAVQANLQLRVTGELGDVLLESDTLHAFLSGREQFEGIDRSDALAIVSVALDRRLSGVIIDARRGTDDQCAKLYDGHPGNLENASSIVSRPTSPAALSADAALSRLRLDLPANSGAQSDLGRTAAKEAGDASNRVTEYLVSNDVRALDIIGTSDDDWHEGADEIVARAPDSIKRYLLPPVPAVRAKALLGRALRRAHRSMPPASVWARARIA
jgi:hypothetical protein